MSARVNSMNEYSITQNRSDSSCVANMLAECVVAQNDTRKSARYKNRSRIDNECNLSSSRPKTGRYVLHNYNIRQLYLRIGSIDRVKRK